MGKYDKIKTAMAEERAFRKEQEELHEKHQEIADDTVIVEKSTAVRSVLSFIKAFAKTIVAIIFILLAATGIITIAYTETREAFIDILSGAIGTIMN